MEGSGYVGLGETKALVKHLKLSAHLAIVRERLKQVLVDLSRLGSWSVLVYGPMRRMVSTRSMERSNEATWFTPVLSAQATRYASAKSRRSFS